MRFIASGFLTLGIMLSLFWHIQSNGERGFERVTVLEMVIAWGFLSRPTTTYQYDRLYYSSIVYWILSVFLKRACRRPFQKCFGCFRRTLALQVENIIHLSGFCSMTFLCMLRNSIFFFFFLICISPTLWRSWYSGLICKVLLKSFLVSVLFEGLDIFCAGTELSRLAAEPPLFIAVLWGV